MLTIDVRYKRRTNKPFQYCFVYTCNMSLNCYESGAMGAVDPDGLPCNTSIKHQMPDFIQAGLYVDGGDEDLFYDKGKTYNFKKPMREVPFGENRRTHHFGGRGETMAPRKSSPFPVTLLNSNVVHNEPKMEPLY